jgi:hypothetical protein
MPFSSFEFKVSDEITALDKTEAVVCVKRHRASMLCASLWQKCDALEVTADSVLLSVQQCGLNRGSMYKCLQGAFIEMDSELSRLIKGFLEYSDMLFTGTYGSLKKVVEHVLQYVYSLDVGSEYYASLCSSMYYLRRQLKWVKESSLEVLTCRSRLLDAWSGLWFHYQRCTRALGKADSYHNFRTICTDICNRMKQFVKVFVGPFVRSLYAFFCVDWGLYFASRVLFVTACDCVGHEIGHEIEDTDKKVMEWMDSLTLHATR